VRTYRQRKYAAPEYLRRALQYLKPPDNLTVSEWAERERVLDDRSSAQPGQWRNSVTPYLVGIMDEFSNYGTEEIIFCKATQVGGTEAMQNMIGYAIAQDPGPTMIVYPTDQLGERTVKNRLTPMMRGSPQLSERFIERISGKDELQFSNMFITIAGANSPSSLASTPIRYLFMDEVDKFPGASKKEADPISLARERTKTYHNRKIYRTSSVTLRTGPIWKAMESADEVRHYFVPCPHCSTYIELKWVQVKWPDKESGLSNEERAEMASYVCQACAAVITDQDKNLMLQRGEWRAVRKSGKVVKSVAFWISTVYSPFVRFTEMAKEWMDSKDDPERLHNFINSWLAEPWEDTKLKTSADLVMERRTELPAHVVPDWAVLLTGGIDVQETSVYWTIRAWGDYMTSQTIAYGQALSLSEAEQIMNSEFRREDGGPMVVGLTLIDSGDQTDMVYDFCVQNSDWSLPCKGTGARDTYFRLSTINKTSSRAHGMTLVLVDSDKYKKMIAGRMRRENGRGSWMVHRDSDMDYANQVTAEHEVIERSANGREATKWVKKQSHADNHYLDAEVYAMCAADIKGIRYRYLQTEAEKKPERVEAEVSAGGQDDWIRINENWLG